MHFNRYRNAKAKSGFLLIEALLAIAILGLMLIPALALLTNSFSQLNAHVFELKRLFFAQQFMAEMERKHTKSTNKFKERSEKKPPVTTLTYQFGPIDEKSNLQGFDTIFKEEVIAQGRKNEPSIKLVQFKYKKIEKKSEQAQ